MGRWLDGWMGWRVDVLEGRLMSESMSSWMDGENGEWVNESMNKWMGGLKGGCVDGLIDG